MRGIGLVAAVAMGAAGLAVAQPAGGKPGEPNPGYLELTNPKFYTVHSKVGIWSYEERTSRHLRDRMPEIDIWKFQAAVVVFPIPPRTASSYKDDPPNPVTSRLMFDDNVYDESAQLITDFPVDAEYGLWQIESPSGGMVEGREMELQVHVPLVTHRTKYNDEAAATVDWPKGPWPEVAQSSFAPMAYVDYDLPNIPYSKEPIQDLIREWTGGNDPKKLKPAILAKFLAGKVLQHVQLSGDGTAHNQNGLIEGINLQGTDKTAIDGRGSPFDMVCFLTAVYREAGIPARPVIGVKAGKSRKDLEFLGGKNSSKDELRAWVEWCLYDERDKTITWIPVDIVEMRSSSSRLRGEFWNQPLRYFGTHDKLDDLCPISFHFFPPTTVRSYSSSGSPGLWGWFVTPQAPGRAVQALQFSVTSTAARAGQERDPEKRRQR